MLSLDTGTPIIGPTPRTVFDPVHFSDLKEIDLSPAHFRASVEASHLFEATRDMRVGTVVHELVLGPHKTKPLFLYDEGLERKGNAWKEYEKKKKAEHPGCEIVTQAEWDDAKLIADAVKADPVARRILEGTRREVKLSWESGGIACETDGIDIVGVGYIGDLKRTSCTEPEGFSRHAAKHHWHVQIAFYDEGARLNGIDTSKGLYLIGVEPVPPYAVTVMRVPQETIEIAQRVYVKWLERLRIARENDHWPTYTQTIVDFILPPWMQPDGGEGGA